MAVRVPVCRQAGGFRKRLCICTPKERADRALVRSRNQTERDRKCEAPMPDFSDSEIKQSDKLFTKGDVNDLSMSKAIPPPNLDRWG